MVSYVFADAVLNLVESGFTFLVGMLLLAFNSLLEVHAVLVTGLAHCLYSQRLHRHTYLHLARDRVLSSRHSNTLEAIQMI